jgi:hypothetical protein
MIVIGVRHEEDESNNRLTPCLFAVVTDDIDLRDPSARGHFLEYFPERTRNLFFSKCVCVECCGAESVVMRQLVHLSSFLSGQNMDIRTVDSKAGRVQLWLDKHPEHKRYVAEAFGIALAAYKNNEAVATPCCYGFEPLEDD